MFIRNTAKNLAFIKGTLNTESLGGKSNTILKSLYDVCSQKAKKIFMFQVKNKEPDKRNCHLSFFFIVNSKHTQFIKPISCECSISMPPRKYPKTFGFLTFLVVIKLVH